MRLIAYFLTLLMATTAFGETVSPTAVTELSSFDRFDLNANSVVIGGRRFFTGLKRRPNGGGLEGSQPYVAPTPEQIAALPESYDARSENLITRIKNQGSCGSCWAFARGKAFETALIKAGHPLELDLAEQDALVNDRSAYGCNGGFMNGDFEVEEGVTTEALCPYRASGRYRCSGAKYAHAVSWTMIGGRRAPTVDELRYFIKEKGALAVTVAAGSGFSPRNGVISTCNSRSINHMVTLVAYRPAASGGYEFLIANSWGTNWGDGGFAWSKQGCNKLASSAGDGALYYDVENF